MKKHELRGKLKDQPVDLDHESRTAQIEKSLEEYESESGVKFRRNSDGGFARNKDGSYIRADGTSMIVRGTYAEEVQAMPEGWTSAKERKFQNWRKEGCLGVDEVNPPSWMDEESKEAHQRWMYNDWIKMCEASLEDFFQLVLCAFKKTLAQDRQKINEARERWMKSGNVDRDDRVNCGVFEQLMADADSSPVVRADDFATVFIKGHDGATYSRQYELRKSGHKQVTSEFAKEVGAVAAIVAIAVHTNVPHVDGCLNLYLLKPDGWVFKRLFQLYRYAGATEVEWVGEPHRMGPAEPNDHMLPAWNVPE